MQFEANEAINAQSPFFMAPEILFPLLSPDPKQLWSTMRELLKQADERPRKELRAAHKV
jgi:hypothetical protein